MMLPYCSLKLEEVPELEDLFSRCFTLRWSKESLEKILKLEGGYHWGLKVKDQLIGFFLGTLLHGELDFINFGIDPLFRRKGLGESLLRAILNQASIRKAFLEVDVENLPAIHLYRKIGFKELSVRKKYYEGKKDALVMWKGSAK